MEPWAMTTEISDLLFTILKLLKQNDAEYTCNSVRMKVVSTNMPLYACELNASYVWNLKKVTLQAESL